ncbi:MAG: hypothetical protein PF481_08975 [Bacteroidales bacterium]|jgi:hypothetical protein|nr:hypothetical protein [Bacteroidales bacterium]
MKILSAKKYKANLKCTIHATGKLGFNEAAAMALEIDNETTIKFGFIENESESEEETDSLYLIKSHVGDEDAFKINKAGAYFYVNAKALFDGLKLDYRNYNIIFDMIDASEHGEGVFKLIKRKRKRKEKL